MTTFKNTTINRCLLVNVFNAILINIEYVNIVNIVNNEVFYMFRFFKKN